LMARLPRVRGSEPLVLVTRLPRPSPISGHVIGNPSRDATVEKAIRRTCLGPSPTPAAELPSRKAPTRPLRGRRVPQGPKHPSPFRR
jgi:hypothetical protein